MYNYRLPFTQSMKDICQQVLLDVGQARKAKFDRLMLIEKIIPNSEPFLSLSDDLEDPYEVQRKMLNCPEKKGRVLAVASAIQEGIITHDDFLEMALHDCGWYNRKSGLKKTKDLLHAYRDFEETHEDVTDTLEFFLLEGGVLP